ncbi:MAG: hypothetical protein M3Q36_03015 [bacterium]|nr:hypothetical protein [bacterium]
MNDNPLLLNIAELTESITSLPGLGVVGVDNAEDRKKIILELHNHLGNVRQKIEASMNAINGTEQFLILKDAQKELDELDNRLLEAHQLSLLTDEHYEHLAEKVRHIKNLISDSLDTEYL